MEISGKSSGTGKYSYHQRSCGIHSVKVTKMPEDDFQIRIAFLSHGETHLPIIKVGSLEAKLLWAALNSMAKDFDWKDYETETSK